MTDLGTEYGPTFTGYPHHMSREDYAIWLRYWPTIRTNVRRMWFDVGLGQGKPSPEGTPANMAQMWRRLNQKRADVVAQIGENVHIIELRDAAQSNAIGRLQIYAMLWNEDPPVAAPVKLNLITNTLDEDVRRLAAHTGIDYTVI